MKKILTIASIVTCLLISRTARAEDLNAIIKRVNEYVAAENFPKALEELSWAEKEIEKMNTAKLGKILPTEVMGFAGQPVKTQSAMGFNTIQRVYKKDKQTIELEIAGGSKSGAAGGLAGLARMGMMMGGEEGSETFRLDGKTASMSTKGNNPEITVALESGSLLKLNARNGVDAETLKTFAEAVKVGEIDNYLRGVK